jgi:DNA polymerase/3'-5' exonuclease PolX
MGLMLSAAQGVIKDGKVIASRTEEEIFAALGLGYVEPKDREV